MISESELSAAREIWGTGLVAISDAYDADGIDAARAVCSQFLDDAYGFEIGPVMFKPTMASGEQTFRPTKAGALSYFVAHDSEFPLDGGFGLKSWRSVTSKTSASFIDGNTAMWMGWVSMTNADGETTTVDKSWGYTKDENGVVRIMLHHSSFPFQP